MEHGCFIIIDGPSASGKDTVIRQVLKDLASLRIKAVSIEETRDRNYDRKKILLVKKLGDRKVAEAIVAERKIIYTTKVVPHLRHGTTVIANRGEPSTLSYQTLDNQISMDDVWNMHRKQDILLPDLVVITTCNVMEAIRRENLRKPSLEQKDKKFMSGKFTIDDRQLIHTNYKKVKSFLEQKDIDVIYLNTDTMDVPEESRRIVRSIKKYL